MTQDKLDTNLTEITVNLSRSIYSYSNGISDQEQDRITLNPSWACFQYIQMLMKIAY